MTLSFAKGGGPKSLDDTIKSTDTFEAILGLCEGPIFGLEDGPKSFFLDQTPLMNVDGKNNFKDFKLVINPGSMAGEELISELGGFSSPRGVGVSLSKDVPVVRQTATRNIDFLEIRIAINQLVRRDPKKGELVADSRFRIEYKSAGSSIWLPVPRLVPNAPPEPLPPTPPGVTDVYVVPGEPGLPNDPFVIVDDAPPGRLDGLWVQPDLNNQPFTYQNTGWVPAGFFNTATNAWENPNGLVVYGQGATPVQPASNSFLINNSAALMFNGTAFRGLVQPLSGALAGDGIFTISGKVSSTTIQEFRFAVPRQDALFDIRVTKLSDDSSANRTDEIAWESFQEVIGTSFRFPYTATAQIVAQATDQFSRVPTLQGVYKGRLVRVPTNYSAESNTYQGLWDGTYKVEWSENPAWITMDLIENNRYGLSRFMQQTCNKWSFYEWARWCDELVNGAKRWTINLLISDQRVGKEVIQYLAGAACARIIDDGDGYHDVLVDRDTPPVALFTRENVIGGEFTYSWTPRQERPNEVTVQFINPDMFWSQDVRRIEDSSDIAIYDRIPLEFEAVGCIYPEEAIRRARYRLVTGLTEKGTVTFSVNRRGFCLSAWDIVLQADDRMQRGLTGRIRAVLDQNRVSLRDAVTFDAGFEYFAIFQVANPATQQLETVRLRIANSVGTHSALEFDDNLPLGIPEQGEFAIESPNNFGTPRAFRVLSTEAAGDDQVNVTLIECNRAKWAYVDAPVGQTDISVSRTLSSDMVPPSNLRVLASTRNFEGSGVRVLRLEWLPSPTSTVRGYAVYQAVNGGPTTLLAETTETYFEIEATELAQYVFSVAAFGPDGRMTRAISTAHDTVGTIRPVFPPEAVVCIGPDHPEPRFEWTRGATVDWSHYEIEIPGKRLERVEVERWPYSEAKQILDGRARTRIFRVRNVDKTGSVSEWVQISFTNAPPQSPVLSYTQELSAYTVYVAPPVDVDTTGLRLWASTTNNFTPSPSNLVFEGAQNSVTLTAAPGQTWYVRAAWLDDYGQGTVSAQMSTASRSVQNQDIEQGALSLDRIAGTDLASLITDGEFAPVQTEILNARRGLSTLLASVSSAALTAAWANVAERPLTLAQLDSVSATQLTSNTSEVVAARNGELTLGGRISTVNTARVDGDAVLTATAQRIESITRNALVSGSALNTNPTFAMWENPTGLPDNWVFWIDSTAELVRAVSNPWALQQDSPNGNVNRGCAQQLGTQVTKGWHVLEADVTLVSGSLLGSGMGLQSASSSASQFVSMPFSTTADTSGAIVGSGTPGRRYRFSLLFEVTLHPTATDLYLFTAWNNYATADNAKRLLWHRCAVRPASNAEVEGGKVPALTASVASQNTTLTNSVNALAGRTSAVEASSATNLSRIQNEEVARAAQDSALSSQIGLVSARTGAGTQILTNGSFQRGTQNWGLRFSNQTTLTMDPQGRLVMQGVSVAVGSVIGTMRQTVDGQVMRLRIKPGQRYAWRMRGQTTGSASDAAPYFNLSNQAGTQSFLAGSSFGTALGSPPGHQPLLGQTYADAGGYWQAPQTLNADQYWLDIEIYALTYQTSGQGSMILEAISIVECDPNFNGVPQWGPSVNADVSDVRTTAIDAQNRARAFVGLAAEVTGRSVQVVLDATTGLPSRFVCAADEAFFTDPSGNPIALFQGGSLGGVWLRNAQATPTAGSNVYHKIALQPLAVEGANGQTIQWQGGNAYSYVPSPRPDPGFLATLPTLAQGEAYVCQILEANTTGGVVRFGKQVAGVLSSQNTGPNTVTGGVPSHRVHKPTSLDSVDNNYTFDISMTGNPQDLNLDFQFGNPAWFLYMTVDLYARQGSDGQWLVVGKCEVSANVPSGGSKTIRRQVSTNIPFAIGQSGDYEFGIYDQEQTTTAITLHSVSYNTQTTSGFTALPGTARFLIEA